MDPLNSLTELAGNTVAQAVFVYALVEVYKDRFPEATAGLQKLAAYCGGWAVSALLVWRPGMPWREYLMLTAYNGVAVGMMAIGGHQTVQRRTNVATPPNV